MMSRILIVDDEPTTAELVAMHLSRGGYEMRKAGGASEMRRLISEEEFDLILLDYMLPDGNGFELIREINQALPDVPIIMITAHGNVPMAVDAMRLGVYDFCPKPIEFNRLRMSVDHALETLKLKKTFENLSRLHRGRFCGMIGGSREMQIVYQMIENVAPTAAPVLITGESGAGKELVAQAIHEHSPRRERELIDVNCAAIPKDLLESELFGHEKSAFTGASRRFTGRFEQAHQSTLFLDEICEMDIDLQAKLLRVLQERSFYRVGGDQKITVDARLVTATNRDPYEAVREGLLREDLFYRINVVNINLPPLRERRDDIPPLAGHMLERYSREYGKAFAAIDHGAMELLCSYSWPGNVRELQNAIQNAVVMNNGPALTREMIPEPVRSIDRNAGILRQIGEYSPTGGEGANGESVGIVALNRLERDAIENALRLTKGNVSLAASGLEISQTTLYRKIKEYNLSLKEIKHTGNGAGEE